MKGSLLKIISALAILSIPIGTRILAHSFISGLHEYEAIFIYASDVFLVAALGAILYFWQYFKQWILSLWQRTRWMLIFLTVFIFVSFLSFLWASSPLLSLYSFARLALVIFFGLFAGFMIYLKKISLRIIFISLVVSAVFQSLLGLLQFARQSDLGFSILGEPVLGAAIPGVAKVAAYGARFIRGYGTFPHPNILSAFLLIGLAAAYYLYIRADWAFHKDKYDFQRSYAYNFRIFIRSGHFHERVLVSIALFIILAGLLITFSRAAWAIGALMTLYFFWWGVRQIVYQKPILRLLPIVVFSAVVLFTQFQWIILPRTNIASSDQSVVERLSYIDLGREIMKTHPIQGVGIGNQVLYAAKNDLYSRFGFSKLWQWQPIHNLYLLMASEMGVFGLIGFLAFLGALFYKISKSEFLISKKIPITETTEGQFKNYDLEIIISVIMLTALLLFGLFDHFLWTLEPGRIMLWLVIGLVITTSDWPLATSDKIGSPNN